MNLVNLQEQFAGQGVVVMEVVQDATSAAALQTWSLGYDYNLMRTTPSTQMQTDIASSQTFEGYPTLPLIDLQTMQVLDSDCWYAASWSACIEAHL